MAVPLTALAVIMVHEDYLMSTSILLIRHGETAWNRAKIFRGRHDIPLNENGRAQARLVAAALESRQIDAAYSSPLSRAMETAKIALQPRPIDVIATAGLTDIDYGEWTGLEETEVARRWPEEYARWTAEPAMSQPAGGETLQLVFARAYVALEEIVRKHEGQTVAIFAHRVVNKALVLAMLGLGVERFPFIRQDNCNVSEFERTRAGYVAVHLNDTCHIRQGGKNVLAVDF